MQLDQILLQMRPKHLKFTESPEEPVPVHQVCLALEMPKPERCLWLQSYGHQPSPDVLNLYGDGCLLFARV